MRELVLKRVRSVPPGRVTTYGDLWPGAPRAAGAVLAGMHDPDVPWGHAVELVSRLARDDVVLTLIKDGDHRLSRPEDLERLIAAVAEF